MMPDTTRSANAHSNTNRSLVQRYLAHSDHAAFAELVERFGPMVFGVSHRLLVDLEDAEDATQLAFAELARRAGTIENLDGLASWLHIVTAHIAIRLRKQRRQHRPLIADPIDSRSSLEDLARRNDFEILTEELEKLPLEWREPLLLRYFSGLSNEDAAERLGTTVTALEGRLKRGKKSLRVRLLRRGVSVAAILTAVGPASNKTLAATGTSSVDPLDTDYWASVTDASRDLASDPTTLTFLPALESTTMAAPILTFKAAATIGTAAVVLAMLGGQGHQDRLSNVTNPISTAVADGVQIPTAVTNQTATVLQIAQTDDAETPPSPVSESPANHSNVSITTVLKNDPFNLKIIDTSLADSMKLISERYDITISIDENALDDVGISVENQFTMTNNFPTLGEALTEILSNKLADLDFVIRGHRIVVTSAEAAAASTSTRRYEVPVGLEPNELVQSLAQHVTQTQRGPVDWEETGGIGVVSVLSLGDREPVLLITQSDRGHEAVKEFMSLLADPSPALPGTTLASKQLRNDILLGLSAGPGVAKSQPANADLTTPPLVSDGGMGPRPPQRDDLFQRSPTDDVATNALSIVAYDIAKLSRLIFAPERKTNTAEYEDYGSGFEAAGGYGGVASSEFGGGGGMGGYGPIGTPSTIRLVTLDDLRQLSKLSIEAELTVQRGSQLLIRTNAENHALIRKAITDLTELFEEAGPPEIEGQTTIQAKPDEEAVYDEFGGGYGEESYGGDSYDSQINRRGR